MNEDEKAVRDFQRKADEAHELTQRLWAQNSLYKSDGYKTIQQELAQRWKAKDPNVILYRYEEGTPDRYELEWTKEQKQRLIDRYMEVRDWSTWAGIESDKRGHGTQ